MRTSALITRQILLAFLCAVVFHGSPVPALAAEETLVTPLIDPDLLIATEPPIATELLKPVSHSIEMNGRGPFGPAWNKAGFQIMPYGAFWADMVFATQRTAPGAFTLFVFSPEEQGEGAFVIDARRTRLGLQVKGPMLGAAETGGKVEIDFHGDFVTENRAGVLLRLAYWEAKSDRARLLIGQNWDVVSPLIPSTLNYGYGYLAGNIGFRRTQIRAERFLPVSDELMFALQGALNQDIVTDFPTDSNIRREASDWPVIEGRLATSLGPRGRGSTPTTVGFSGHIGETGFDFLTAGPPPLNLPPADDARFKTWSFNIDIRAPLTDSLGVQGEFFTGANLSTLLGGVGQGICPCLREPIRSRGGWGEMWYDVTPNRRIHLGYGIDDPNNADLLFGRSSNQFLFANVVQAITRRLTVGFEVTYWRTDYFETRFGQIPDDQLTSTEPGKSVTFDWMFKYEF